MLSAEAEVPQTAFVAVDHWRGDPSSRFLLLSPPGASAPLWHGACLCSAFSSAALPPLVVFLTAGVRERRKSQSVWKNHCVLRLRHRDLCICVLFPPVFVLHMQQGNRAHRSRKTHSSFRAISKVLNCFP